MIKRQLRIQRINNVFQEYLAASTAAELLVAETKPNPSYGSSKGWDPKAGDAFVANLEATYLIRIYAEFEAGLRDYWLTYRKKDTQPMMYQLLNQAIPTQHFTQDCIDRADEVREYRNFLVHDIEGEPNDDRKSFTVRDAKKHLCAYIACLDVAWR
jgi:hypothetical protein